MLEIIKSQYESGLTLSKSRFYQYHSPEVAQITSEMYPYGMDYFHELNPAFLFRVPRAEFLNQFTAVTVRDGAASFGAFILKNFQQIAKSNTHYFIHPKLAPLVPANIKSKFSSWHIVQAKKIKISEAKRVVILGLMNDQVLPTMDKIEKQLEILSQVSPTCQVDLFLPVKRNPFGLVWTESYMGYEIVERIKKIIPHKKITYLTHKDLLEKPSWQDTYCIDMLTNKLILSDSYMNHFIAARGGTISTFNDVDVKDSVFEIDVNFHHKIQFTPLPVVESIFAEMMFYKKQAYTKDFAADPVFHDLLREYDL